MKISHDSVEYWINWMKFSHYPVNPIPHGLFWVPYSTWGGAKLPTLSKITPDALITPKLTHNVELLYYF